MLISYIFNLNIYFLCDTSYCIMKNLSSVCVVYTCMWIIDRNLLFSIDIALPLSSQTLLELCIPHKHAYALMLPTLNTLASALPRLSHVSLCFFLSPFLSSVTFPDLRLTSFCVHALNSSCFLLVYSAFFLLFSFILAWLPVFYHFTISFFHLD